MKAEAYKEMREWLATQLDGSLKMVENLEELRRTEKNAAGLENLTRSLMHWEGRVCQIRRSLDFVSRKEETFSAAVMGDAV